jgi:hypothetical protein
VCERKREREREREREGERAGEGVLTLLSHPTRSPSPEYMHVMAKSSSKSTCSKPVSKPGKDSHAKYKTVKVQIRQSRHM